LDNLNTAIFKYFIPAAEGISGIVSNKLQKHCIPDDWESGLVTFYYKIKQMRDVINTSELQYNELQKEIMNII
jgi:hypothetical protein